VSQNIRSFNLETVVGRKKDAQGIGVHREIKKFVVTLLVMRHFAIVRGAPRACVDFCDPTAVSRFKVNSWTIERKGSEDLDQSSAPAVDQSYLGQAPGEAIRNLGCHRPSCFK